MNGQIVAYPQLVEYTIKRKLTTATWTNMDEFQDYAKGKKSDKENTNKITYFTNL